MNFETILSNISIWSVVVPLIVGFSLIRRISIDSMLILGIVAFATIPQLTQLLTDSKIVENISYNLYTPLEFLLLFFIFRTKVKTSTGKIVLWILLFIYTIFSIYFLFNYSIFDSFISIWVCINNIIYCIWILMVIVEEYKLDIFKLDPQKYFFWYTLGLILYAPSTLLLFSLWTYIKNHPNSSLTYLWTIHHIFNTLMYLLFSVGFIVDYTMQKSQTKLLAEE